MTFASAGGIRIAYDDLGSGEGLPLLMTTGWCSSRARWSATAELLARNRRVLNTEWRGHGESDPAPDFGLEELIEDVLAVAEHAGVERFVPCAVSHSGFVAIELRRRYPERIPMLVHADWYVVPPPPPFSAILEQLTTSDWPEARATLFRMWKADSEAPEIQAAIDVMAAHGADMWGRAGREISAGYAREVSPFEAWAGLDPSVPVLHVYGQPTAPEFLAAQEEFSEAHEWFTVRKLPGVTHFAMIETPIELAGEIEGFVARHSQEVS